MPGARTFATTQTWNDRHLLATVQASSGLTTAFTYDAQGRVATQSGSLGTRHRVASYTAPRAARSSMPMTCTAT